MTYVATVLDFLFGCHHNSLSRVFTIGGRSYQVCCDCGTQFTYSLETMSIQRRDFSWPEPAPCHIAHLKSAH